MATTTTGGALIASVVWTVLGKLAALLSPFVIFSFGLVLGHNSRIDRLEATAFTIERQNPAVIFIREQLAEIKVNLVRIDDRLQRIERR